MRYALLVLFLLAPVYVFGAGFASESIFLSKTGVVEGESVLVHVVVRNDADEVFEGTLTLSESGNNIGSADLELEVGAADTVSFPWSPKAGSYTVTAELKAQNGDTETDSATFVIKPKPPPPAAVAGKQAATAIESSKSIQESIAGVSPQVAKVAAPVFILIDGGRAKAADALDRQLVKTKPKVEQHPIPQVTGEEAPSTSNWFWSIFYTLYFYLLTILRFVVGKAAVFYPMLAAAFLYLLYKMFRKFKRN